MGENFAKIKTITGNCRSAQDQRSSNNSLIKVNEELLWQIKTMEDLAVTNDQIFAGLTRQLEEERRNGEEVKMLLLSLEKERKHRQEKVAAEQRRNEALVREVNSLKLKLKENLKDLQALKAEESEHDLTTTSIGKQSRGRPADFLFS